jgi:hypothetical protein
VCRNERVGRGTKMTCISCVCVCLCVCTYINIIHADLSPHTDAVYHHLVHIHPSFERLGQLAHHLCLCVCVCLFVCVCVCE